MEWCINCFKVFFEFSCFHWNSDISSLTRFWKKINFLFPTVIAYFKSLRDPTLKILNWNHWYWLSKKTSWSSGTCFFFKKIYFLIFFLYWKIWNSVSKFGFQKSKSFSDLILFLRMKYEKNFTNIFFSRTETLPWWVSPRKWSLAEIGF